MAAAKHDVETGEADDSLLVVLGQEMDEMIANQTVQEYVKTRARHEGLKKVKPFDGDNTWLSGMKDDEAKAFMRGLSQEKKTAYSHARCQVGQPHQADPTNTGRIRA